MAIVLQIVLDEQGNIQQIEKLNKALRETGKASKDTSKEMSGLESALDKAAKKYLTFAVAYQQIRNMAGLAKNLSIEFTNTAMSFEQMKVALETLTKGQGQKWFADLNLWALKMPINTQAAVQGFIRMRAMGLEPTIEQMTILSDATSALGGRADTFDGLVLAMGQIQTKGQLMSQELRQLAERGIPAYEILQEKLGITGRELETTNHKAISANIALKALYEGMNERFGGMSKNIMGIGVGIKEQLVGNWTEFQRVMMDSGPYDFVKQQMKELANSIERDTTVMKFNYIKGVRGQKIGQEMFGDDKEFMRLIAEQRSGYAFADPAMIANRTKYYNQIAVLYEKLKEQEAGVNVTLPGYRRVTGAMSKNDLNLNLPVEKPIAEEQEKASKRSFKLLEQEYKMWAELDKRYSGQRTQSTEQRLSTSRQYLESVLRDEKDAKIEIDMTYWNELQELQQKGRATQIQLQFDGIEREKELVKAEYDAKIAKYEEGDARIVELRRNLAMELELIDRDGIKRTEAAIVNFGVTWGNMWANAAQQSGSAVDNIVNDLKRLGVRLAAQSIVAEAAGLFMGMPFGTGTMAMVKNLLPFGKGMAEGGYTGNQMGFYHPQEYVNNAKTVDFWGVGFFDKLAKIAQTGGGSSFVMNNNFSAAEKVAMANEPDAILAERINRLVRERMIKISA